MKKSLLTITLLLTGVVNYAQVVFNVKSPAAISGNYDFSYADAAGGWTAIPDLLNPLNAVEDTLMFVEDGTPGLNPQGHAISREGCNSLINDLTGKIAVVYRNTCEFGSKAFNAMTAGARAVIVINRDDEVIAMGPGADGAAVTIPAIFISSSAGQIITDQMANGFVVGFIGTKLGLHDYDLGLIETRVLNPSPNTTVGYLGLNATENDQKLGAMVYNYGNENQTNITLTATVMYNGSTVFTQSVMGAASLDFNDSVLINLPDFSLASYPLGKYTLTYTVTSDNDQDDTSDDMYSIDFYVSENLYSHAGLDANNLPDGHLGYRSTTGTTSYGACVHFQHPNASRLILEGIYFSASIGDTTLAQLMGQEFTIDIKHIDETFGSLNDVATPATYSNFTDVNTSPYQFSGEYTDSMVYAPLTAPVTLIDNDRYLACVTTFDVNTYLGFTSIDYTWNLDTLVQPISPIISNDVLNLVGFGGTVASIGLKLMPNLTVPVITSNGLNTICEGQSVTLFSSSATGNQWQKDGSDISGETGSSLDVTTAGTYTVVNGLNVSDPVVIAVNTIPATPTITASGATTFCIGGSVDLTASSVSNNVWSNGSTADMITVTASGTYTVTNYNGICGASSTATVVMVNDLPVISIDAPGATFAVCNGSTVDLTASGASTYVWGGGEITDMITVSPATNTTYTVVGTDGNGCQNTATADVESLASISAAIDSDPSDMSICIGETATLLASNGATYTWEDATTGNVRMVSPTVTTTYTVTAQLGLCFDDAQVTITVNSLPTVDAGADLSGCEGTIVVLTATGATDYTWSTGEIGSGSNHTVGASNETITVTGTDANGCSNTDQVMVIASPTPTITFGSSNIICDDAPAQTLVVTVVPAGGTGSFSANPAINGMVFNPDAATVGTVTLIYNADVNGCTASETFDMTVAFCSSISEETANSVLVYPNPAVSELTIKAENLKDYSSVVLNDQLGRTVGTWAINNNIMTIDVSKFATGNYTMILNGMNGNNIQHVQIK